MMKNKQGMSAVVTTLIIILLVIVALGIIWVVVKNVIQGGVEQVDLSTKCREVEIQAVSFGNTTNVSDVFDLVIKRTGGGSDIDVDGIRVVIFSDTENSEVTDWVITGSEKFKALETRSGTVTVTSAIENANKIEMTVFFLDDLDKEQFCLTPVVEEF